MGILLRHVYFWGNLLWVQRLHAVASGATQWNAKWNSESAHTTDQTLNLSSFFVTSGNLDEGKVMQNNSTETGGNDIDIS